MWSIWTKSRRCRHYLLRGGIFARFLPGCTFSLPEVHLCFGECSYQTNSDGKTPGEPGFQHCVEMLTLESCMWRSGGVSPVEAGTGCSVNLPPDGCSTLQNNIFQMTVSCQVTPGLKQTGQRTGQQCHYIGFWPCLQVWPATPSPWVEAWARTATRTGTWRRSPTTRAASTWWRSARTTRCWSLARRTAPPGFGTLSARKPSAWAFSGDNMYIHTCGTSRISLEGAINGGFHFRAGMQNSLGTGAWTKGLPCWFPCLKWMKIKWSKNLAGGKRNLFALFFLQIPKFRTQN